MVSDGSAFSKKMCSVRQHFPNTFDVSIPLLYRCSPSMHIHQWWFCSAFLFHGLVMALGLHFDIWKIKCKVKIESWESVQRMQFSARFFRSRMNHFDEAPFCGKIAFWGENSFHVSNLNIANRTETNGKKALLSSFIQSLEMLINSKKIKKVNI